MYSEAQNHFSAEVKKAQSSYQRYVLTIDTSLTRTSKQRVEITKGNSWGCNIYYWIPKIKSTEETISVHAQHSLPTKLTSLWMLAHISFNNSAQTATNTARFCCCNAFHSYSGMGCRFEHRTGHRLFWLNSWTSAGVMPRSIKTASFHTPSNMPQK